MNEQFSDRARHVMALAAREAARLRHDHVGPEHILLGLLSQGDCVASTVLAHANVDLERVRDELTRQVQASESPSQIGRRPYHLHTRAVIEHAIAEARDLHHRYVGTEHLLLGILHLKDCLAARILISQGVKLDHLRQETLVILGFAAGPGHDVSARSFGEFEWIHQEELAKGLRSTAFWHMLILAVDSANRLGHSQIGPEHLLLAVLRDTHNPLRPLLEAKGVTADWLREQIAHGDTEDARSVG